MIIRDCYFDLPSFRGTAIEVWNQPHDEIKEEDRSLNRQFTLIENNYMEMPQAVCFVNCFGYTDYATIRNNSGCVNRALVIVNKTVPGSSTHPIKNKTHNLVIEKNTLRYQKYTKDDLYKNENGEGGSMTILSGINIENLVLANNTVEGRLWNMWDWKISGNLTGTIRVTDNQTTGEDLFSEDNFSTRLLFPDINVFFSGNICNGKKTDLGEMSLANSPTEGLIYNGRQFFCTADNTLRVFFMKDFSTEISDINKYWHVV